MHPHLRFLISGLLAAAVFAVGYAVAITVPGAGDASAKGYTSFYTSDARMTVAGVLFAVLIAGCIGMIWFFTEWRSRLPDGLLTRVGYTAAVFGAVALPVGAAIMTGPAGAVQKSSNDFVGVAVASAFAQAGLGIMLGVGMTGFAVGALLLCQASRRASLVPRWVAIVGTVLSVLTLASFFWIPGYAFILCIALVSVTAGRGSESPVARAQALAAQRS